MEICLRKNQSPFIKDINYWKKIYIFIIIIMSQTVDFMFNNISRIGQDTYNHTQEATINNAYASYTLTNFSEKNENKALSLSTKYPTMNMQSTSQLGPYGSHVDDSSDLLKSKLTNANTRINLQERSYLTVPYLGKGSVDVGLENNLKFGDTFKEKKSSAQLNEKSYSDLEKFPLHKDLKNDTVDPKKHIEELAAKGWVRGGLPSREIYKNKNVQHN
jgi:hypothetical protein